MDIIVQQAYSLYGKEEKNIVGDEDSDGYGKLMELVEGYRLICSREADAAETSNPTTNSTATSICGRSLNQISIIVLIPHQAQCFYS